MQSFFPLLFLFFYSFHGNHGCHFLIGHAKKTPLGTMRGMKILRVDSHDIYLSREYFGNVASTFFFFLKVHFFSHAR